MGRAVLPSGVVPREVLLPRRSSPSSRIRSSTPSTPTACAGSCRSAATGTTATRSSSSIRGCGWCWGSASVASTGRRSARGLRTAGGGPARIALGGRHGVRRGDGHAPGVAARHIARRELEALDGAPVERLMVATAPVHAVRTTGRRGAGRPLSGRHLSLAGTALTSRRPPQLPATRPRRSGAGRRPRHSAGTPFSRVGPLPHGAGGAGTRRRLAGPPDRPALRRPPGRRIRQRDCRGG